MKNSVSTQLTLCSMPQREIRGLSFTSAIKSGLRPYEYKSVLYAHDDCHSHRYTPKDREFDFSQSGIEGSLFYLVTRKTRTGKTSWQNARLLLGPDQQAAIRDRIFEVFSGVE